jgi:hypothetical protein
LTTASLPFDGARAPARVADVGGDELDLAQRAERLQEKGARGSRWAMRTRTPVLNSAARRSGR